MKDKASYVQTMFTAIAGRYDLLNSLLSFQQDRAWRRLVASRANLQPGDLALDIATGTGKMAQLLAQHNSKSKIVGIDFCPDMLDKARDNLANSPHRERIQLLSGDALRLPFSDNSFDCVTIVFALRNVVSIANAFHEMIRVLKPGGRVVSLELTRPTSWFIRPLYHVYLHYIMPSIGRLVSGNREAYTYLPQSIMIFSSPQEVKRIMEEAGMKDVETHSLTLGTATVHTGIKGI